jgi:ectoine hydroxylase-related dioxygenase (phytanoyl-CoA dioxygenase family)
MSMASWTPEELPVPRRDLAALQRDLDLYGYCLVAEALSAEEARAIRARVEEQAAAERELQLVNVNEAHADATNQWVSLLINKGRVFRDLVTHPTTLALVRHVLGPEVLLSSNEAHIVRPGGSPMGLHVDQWWLPLERPAVAGHARVGAATRAGVPTGAPDPVAGPIWQPVVCNVIFMASDFTAVNGATRIVPKSHLSGHQPSAAVPHPVETVAAEGPAGTALVFEGRTWHAAGLNLSNGPRIGLPTYYCGPQFRQLTNFTLGTRREVLREASPELLRVLGFKVWSTYGSTDDTGADFVRFDAEPVGELRPGNPPAAS